MGYMGGLDMPMLVCMDMCREICIDRCVCKDCSTSNPGSVFRNGFRQVHTYVNTHGY